MEKLILRNGTKRKIGEGLQMRVYFYEDKIVIRPAFRHPESNRFKEIARTRYGPNFIMVKGEKFNELALELGQRLLRPDLNWVAKKYYFPKHK